MTGWHGVYSSPLTALTCSIDVYVTYPSGVSRKYEFENYAKACAFVGRTLAKNPLNECLVSVPCQSELYNFNLYKNSRPTPSIKSVTLKFVCK